MSANVDQQSLKLQVAMSTGVQFSWKSPAYRDKNVDDNENVFIIIDLDFISETRNCILRHNPQVASSCIVEKSSRDFSSASTNCTEWLHLSIIN